jgi:hypothetical protein
MWLGKFSTNQFSKQNATYTKVTTIGHRPGFSGWAGCGSAPLFGLVACSPQKEKADPSSMRARLEIETASSCIATMSNEEDDYMSMVIEEPTQKETFTQRKRREQREVRPPPPSFPSPCFHSPPLPVTSSL